MYPFPFVCRLHPNSLELSLSLIALLSTLTGIALKKRVCRIGVTPSILSHAQDNAEAAEPEGAPIIQRRFQDLYEVFKSIDLVDEERGTWCGRDKVPSRNRGNQLAIEAALENGDDIIITEHPSTLPQNILAYLGIRAITFKQLLFEIRQTSPELMRRVLKLHREDTEMTPEMYKDFLESERLGHLVPLSRVIAK